MTLIDRHEVELFFERYFEAPMRPEGDSWGFFVEDIDPAPPKAAYFLWFKSQMASIQFIDKFPLFIRSGDASEKQIHAVRAMLKASLESGFLKPEVLEGINAEWKDESFKIVWWGQFKELCNEQSPFAIELREYFSQRPSFSMDNGKWVKKAGGAKDSSPIQVDQMAHFVDFVRDWGQNPARP